MKMTRTILRRLEMKIHHAMTLDEVRKNTVDGQQPKPESSKPAEQLLQKLNGGI